jgi:hypothetical protein
MPEETKVELQPELSPDDAGNVEIKLSDAVEKTLETTAAITSGAVVSPSVPEPDAVADLKKQIADANAKRARELAQKDRELAAAQQRATNAEQQAVVNRRDAVAITVESLGQMSEAAKRDYKAAMEAGDFGKAAEAQEKLARVAAKLEAAEQGRYALDEAAKRQPQQSNLSPMEQLIQNGRIAGRSAEWLRAHPELASTPQKLIAAHNSAVELKGATVDSDEYFQIIERELGLESQGRVADPEPAKEPTPRAPISAPVVRNVPTMSGNKSSNGAYTVQLSRSEQDTAIANNLDTKLDPEVPADRQKIFEKHVENMRRLDREKPGWNSPNYQGQH